MGGWIFPCDRVAYQGGSVTKGANPYRFCKSGSFESSAHFQPTPSGILLQAFPWHFHVFSFIPEDAECLWWSCSQLCWGVLSVCGQPQDRPCQKGRLGLQRSRYVFLIYKIWRHISIWGQVYILKSPDTGSGRETPTRHTGGGLWCLMLCPAWWCWALQDVR